VCRARSPTTVTGKQGNAYTSRGRDTPDLHREVHRSHDHDGTRPGAGVGRALSDEARVDEWVGDGVRAFCKVVEEEAQVSRGGAAAHRAILERTHLRREAGTEADENLFVFHVPSDSHGLKKSVSVKEVRGRPAKCPRQPRARRGRW
jgi:hypothetical protein